VSFSSMLMILCICLIAASRVVAGGVNQGGVLVVHHDPSLVATAACDSSAVPAVCSNLVPTGTVSSALKVWHVCASFSSAISDRLAGVEFGFGEFEESAVSFVDWGPCGDSPLEIPTEGWPGPNSGTAIAWSDCRSGRVIPVYAFSCYVYGAVTIPLGPNPTRGDRMFEGCAEPTVLDSIAYFGTMGFGMTGNNPCPTGGLQ